jgi:hypothetical protein
MLKFNAIIWFENETARIILGAAIVSRSGKIIHAAPEHWNDPWHSQSSNVRLELRSDADEIFREDIARTGAGLLHINYKDIRWMVKDSWKKIFNNSGAIYV